MKKKLRQLLAECRQDKLKDIDLKIEAFVETLNSEELLEVVELSDQPVSVEMPSSIENTLTADVLEKNFVRPAAQRSLDAWLQAALEEDVCEMAYGDYLVVVDNMLEERGKESTDENEMAVVDQMQCDAELPHTCMDCILTLRYGTQTREDT